MTLLDHHSRTELRPVREHEPVKWTCAKCGVVVNGMSAAAHHIELHRPQDRPQPARARRMPAEHAWLGGGGMPHERV